MTAPVACRYCDAAWTTDPHWLTVKESQRAHWFAACKRLPWWRRLLR